MCGFTYVDTECSNLPGKGLKVSRDEFYWQTKSCRKAKQKFSEAATVTLDIVFCVTLHHVAFENFLHEVNWVGTFWSEV